MTELILPSAFEPTRQSVGIFTPSSPAPHDFPGRFKRSIANLSKLGWSWVEAPHTRTSLGYVSATAKCRADDLHHLIADDAVGMILATVGGLNSNGILDYLDIDLLRSHPKPIIGFSDVTALLLAITRRAGVVTFHGPALLPNFGDPSGVDKFTLAALLGVVGVDQTYRFHPASEFTDEFRLWDGDDDTLRALRPDPGWSVLIPGDATGPLWGGNLDTLLALAGTDAAPDFEGALLFWETAFCGPAKLERDLTALRQLGAFENMAAMIVGKPFRFDGSTEQYRACILEALKGLNRPTVLDMNFGHTLPMITLPIGIEARLSTEPLVLELINPAVRK